MRKNIFLGLLIALLLALLAYFFVFYSGGKNVFNGKDEYAGAGQKENILLGQRKAYGISQTVFSELPAPPTDFNRIVGLYLEGRFTDDFFFSEKYFLQPEFYPSFVRNGLGYWLNPSTTHWAAYGYGSFPIRKTITIKQGEKARARFFIHSGYGVRSYQGIGLKAVFSDEKAGDFFEVKIGEPAFLLGPNYPKFERNWAKDVLIEILPKGNTPKGTYALSVFVSSPPAELGEKWEKEIKGIYFDAGFASVGDAIFELAVAVE